MKKLFAMLLIVSLVLGMLPVMASAEAEAATPSIETVSMTLNGILDVNFKVNANGTDMTGYSVNVTIGSAETTQSITSYTIDGDYYVYTAKLPAHRLPETLSVELLCGDTTVQSTTWTAGTDYLSKLTGSDELIALAEALQDYGTYAAAYANGEVTDELDGITAEDLVAYEPVVSVKNAELGAVAALYLDDACDLNIKFNSDAWSEEYQLLIDGTAVETAENGSGKTVGGIVELLPQDWSHMYSIEVASGEETVFACTYSVASYIYQALSQSSELAVGLNNLLKAMYIYGEAAKVYNPRFYIDSITGDVTADAPNGTLTYGGAGNTQTYFAAGAEEVYATNWELSGTITKNEITSNLFLSFGVLDSEGSSQWFCLYNTDVGISLRPTWDWSTEAYLFDGTNVWYNQAASDFFWKHTDNLNYKLILADDVLSAYFSAGNDALAKAWSIPLTDPTFGAFSSGSAYQLGIYTVDPCAMVISDIDCTTYNVEPVVNDKFAGIETDGSSYATVVADTAAGTIRYDYSTDYPNADDEVMEVAFLASADQGGYARSWEMSGTITKDALTDPVYVAFGVKNPAGYSSWFCIYEDSVALQRYWNWADTKQANGTDAVAYNQAACSFFWKEGESKGHNAISLDYKIIIQNDVLYAYFGNEACSCGSCGMQLAWTFDLTQELYGGFASGTAYQLCINTVQPCNMTISDIQVTTSGFGFALSDIAIRDPFILSDNGTYYLYGTQDFGYFNVYSSTDLASWNYVGKCFEGDSDFWGNDTTNSEQAYWAPEVYAYNGAYYMLATFTQAGSGNQQASAIFKADSPVGPFEAWSDGAITPAGHSCLDATLYFENGTPYLIYAHEWECSCKDDGVGSMDYIQLSDDLKTTTGESTQWFTAAEFTDISWWESLWGSSDSTTTDAPFVYEDADGQKYLLWATHVDSTYIEVATKFSALGESINVKSNSFNLYDDNGGHGMIFESNDGEDILVLHTPNSGATAHAKLFHVTASSGSLSITEVKQWDWYQSDVAQSRAAEYAASGVDGSTTLFVGDSFFDISFWDNFYTDLDGYDAMIAGIGGSTAEDWENYFSYGLFLDGIAPKNLVFNIGNNDIFNDQLSAADAQTTMTRLYTRLHAAMPETKIYVFSITARQGSYITDATEEAMYELNGAMYDWCEAQGDWITYVDISGYDMTLTDDIHPADEHYNNVFLPALIEAGCEMVKIEEIAPITYDEATGIYDVANSTEVESGTYFAWTGETGTVFEVTAVINPEEVMPDAYSRFGLGFALKQGDNTLLFTYHHAWLISCVANGTYMGYNNCCSANDLRTWFATANTPVHVKLVYNRGSLDFYGSTDEGATWTEMTKNAWSVADCGAGFDITQPVEIGFGTHLGATADKDFTAGGTISDVAISITEAVIPPTNAISYDESTGVYDVLNSTEIGNGTYFAWTGETGTVFEVTAVINPEEVMPDAYSRFGLGFALKQGDNTILFTYHHAWLISCVANGSYKGYSNCCSANDLRTWFAAANTPVHVKLVYNRGSLDFYGSTDDGATWTEMTKNDWSVANCGADFDITQPVEIGFGTHLGTTADKDFTAGGTISDVAISITEAVIPPTNAISYDESTGVYDVLNSTEIGNGTYFAWTGETGTVFEVTAVINPEEVMPDAYSRFGLGFALRQGDNTILFTYHHAWLISCVANGSYKGYNNCTSANDLRTWFATANTPVHVKLVYNRGSLDFYGSTDEGATWTEMTKNDWSAADCGAGFDITQPVEIGVGTHLGATADKDFTAGGTISDVAISITEAAIPSAITYDASTGVYTAASSSEFDNGTYFAWTGETGTSFEVTAVITPDEVMPDAYSRFGLGFALRQGSNTILFTYHHAWLISCVANGTYMGYNNCTSANDLRTWFATANTPVYVKLVYTNGALDFYGSTDEGATWTEMTKNDWSAADCGAGFDASQAVEIGFGTHLGATADKDFTAGGTIEDVSITMNS